jgi:hypothetical protein
LNKKVQRRQKRVRHARREEILQAGRQWLVEPALEGEAAKSRLKTESAGKTKPISQERDLR